MNINFESLLYEYESLSSTQIEAKRLFSIGVRRAVVTAKRQTSGRGRHSRCWESPDGGLYVSFLFTPQIRPSLLHLVNIASALAVRDTLRSWLKIPAILKWPNDVLVEPSERKICGILCESGIDSDRVSYCVVGIGINCNKSSIPSDLIARACAIDEFVIEPNRDELLRLVAEDFFSRVELLDEASSELLTEYREKCVTLGRNVRMDTNGGIILGTAIGIDENGELIVKRNNGKIQSFSAADAFHAKIEK